MTASRRILICDDEPALADEVAETFTLLGWDAEAAYDYAAAARLLTTALPFTCLLTDRAMPFRDGEQLMEFASSLPQDRRPRLLAVMTGVEDGSHYQHLAHFSVMKPFDLSALSSRLTHELELLP